MLGELGERVVHRHGVLELCERLVERGRLDLLVRELDVLTARPVDALPPCQLRDPRPDRLVAPQLAEVLVDLREDVLEDVLGFVRREP